MTEETTRRHALWNLILTNEGLVGDVKVKGSLGCSAHEMVEFKILRKRRRVKNKVTALEFRSVDFRIFKNLLGRILWDRVLEGRKAQESWLIFKDHILQSQEQTILGSRKSGKNARRPV